MEGKQPKLTPEQREAIDTLSSTPQYQGESKIKIFMKIPAKDKAAYSRTHFLVPLLAAVIVIALGTFVIVRLVSPVPRPALYAAAVSGSTPMGGADKLKDDYAKKLGKDVIIDDYFDMNKDGLSKLQTMIGNEQIDVVIAPHDVFAKLASFGYFDNLKTTLPAAEYAKVGKYAMAFHGFDDSRVTDAIDESGSGQGKSEPYGLLLEHAPRWDRIEGADDDALVGIAANTQQLDTAKNFIQYLYN